MWEELSRVNWGQLSHAYGRARDLPTILTNLISLDEQKRAAGWGAFWGAVNHQGDFYDSTVAAIPFLIEAVNRMDIPDRASILNYFRVRWLDAPQYGGDPLVEQPPGSTDEPTPMLTDAVVAAITPQVLDEREETETDEEFDIGSYRRMDLCAWQTGRAIQAGRPTFERLLEDPDREVAAAAAELLLLWPQTRGAGKRTLIQIIENEPNSFAQGRYILEFGVYADAEDEAALAEWVSPHWPAEVRAAAALAWAWVVNPMPLPNSAAQALRDCSASDSDTFAQLPWVGVYHRGPWILPANAAELILRLAENKDKEVRWRAVQGLQRGWWETAKHLATVQVVPVLIDRLSDGDNRVRAAAAFALAQRGESILEFDPNVVPALLHTLEDTDSSACGHAARLLAAISHRLTPTQREKALAGVDRAAHRFSGKENRYVQFHSLGIQAGQFLKKQRGPIQKPISWDVPELFAAFFSCDKDDGPLSPEECDHRLANAYAQAPQQTVATAVTTVRDATDRTAAMGAAYWLMTLGPAAKPALEALDAMAKGQLDSYARHEACIAGEFIRKSLLVTPESGGESASSSDAFSGRNRIALLTRALRENKLSISAHAPLDPELIDYLDHPDAYVRAGAAELLANRTPSRPLMSKLISVLTKMLADDAVAELGITTRFRIAGRLYHWHQVRHSPRHAAIGALIAINCVPQGDRLLTAMLAESMNAEVICARRALPHRFPLVQWRLAVTACGGLSVADPVIRAARQQCHVRAWSENNADHVASASEAELTEVIRQLSGRLV